MVSAGKADLLIVCNNRPAGTGFLNILIDNCKIKVIDVCFNGAMVRVSDL